MRVIQRKLISFMNPRKAGHGKGQERAGFFCMNALRAGDDT